jgi:tetratricopeptide (TPR) repeat protein
MKIAVYTIALNEEQFVQSWFDSAKEADYLLIADTGSTDKTVKKAKALGINVINVVVKPWRFDMARNASLAAIPADIDYCIALDMDEVLLPGWREELEKALSQGATRPRYQYTWSWEDEEKGIPGLQYGGDKIHARNGYRWKHPVHEVLTSYGDLQETQVWVDLEIHHHPDNSKSRSQYMPLLAQAVAEDLSDDRNAFYYARELYFYGMYEDAIKEFNRHLQLPRAVWPPERAASMRYLGKIYETYGNFEEAKLWYTRAVEQSPGRREPFVDLAKHYYAVRDWENCLKASEAALEIQEKPLEYLCEAESWGALPYDLAALSCYNLGNNPKALEYNEEALKLDPSNLRLIENHQFYSAD